MTISVDMPFFNSVHFITGLV